MNYFLKIFIDFFIFLIQIQIWKFVSVATARYRYRTPAVTTVTALYRAVTDGKKTMALTRSNVLQAHNLVSTWPSGPFGTASPNAKEKTQLRKRSPLQIPLIGAV
jgi:hypothetical protein